MGRYKANLEKRLKGFIEWKLEHYHENKRQLEEYKRDMIPSATPAYSLAAGGHSGESRPAENISLKIIDDQYVRQTACIVDAIERVMNKLSRDDYMLIDLVYWKGSHSIEGAALALHTSKSTAYRKINAIITAIAKELGYVSI